MTTSKLHPRVIPVHQTPGRTRLRVHGHMDDSRRKALAAVLAKSSLVISFRIVWSCRTVVVVHVADAARVCQLVQEALRSGTHAERHERIGTVAQSTGRRPCRRAASRRLIWCSLIALALTIMPTPARPVLGILRMAVSLAVALVQRHARNIVAAPAPAQWIDRLAFAIGLLRADMVLHELVSGWLRGQAFSMLHAPVQHGRGAALLPSAA